MQKDRVAEYLAGEHWRIKENSNTATTSYAGLINFVAGAAVAEHILEHKLPKRIAERHRTGDFHIHDLGNGLVPYCAGWDLQSLLLCGFLGPYHKERPAKHFDSALQQLGTFLLTLQGEWAGAQAVNSFDTLLAPFIRHDNLSYREVKQRIQNFVCLVNAPVRVGQTAFTNITFDCVCPKDMRQRPVVIGGEPHPDWTYDEFLPEMRMINRAFLETMVEGDANGRTYTFPIPTYNITADFDYESEDAKLLFEVTGKYGIPNFQNFVNSDLDPSDTRSMCCRIQLNLKEIRKKVGGLFGAGDKTGAVGVVTLNIPRLAYQHKGDPEGFYKAMDGLLDDAVEMLTLKREWVTQNFEQGLMPYSRIYLDDLSRHFSVIGVIGLHEASLNFMGQGIGTPEGKQFASEVLQHLISRTQEVQERTGVLYNVEGVPGEGTSYRLAKSDKAHYPDIITAGDEVPYYTNSTHLPVGYTDDIFEAALHQDSLQSLYTGGTMFHGYLGEQIEDPALVGRIIRRLCERTRMPYMTLTPTYSICPVHGYIPGAHHECPFDK